MTILHFTLTSRNPTRDEVYIRGFRENNISIIDCRDNAPGLRKFKNLYTKHRALHTDYDAVFVGYTAHILVPFARLISRKKIIFNALSSLYEGIIISRSQGSPFSPRALYCWCVDFLAFHSAHISLVESAAQKDYIHRMFFVPSRKLEVAWTGVDDSHFFPDPSISKDPTFTVLFRGAFLPESGIEYAVGAAKILASRPDIRFRIIGSGIGSDRVRALIKSFDARNIEWIEEKLPFDDLRKKIQECHISLGQLSNHERLIRTIPHKAFESMVMGIPYLTARNKAVLELFKENETCLCANPADAQDLAQKIVTLKDNAPLRSMLTKNACGLYRDKLTPRILAQYALSAMLRL